MIDYKKAKEILEDFSDLAKCIQCDHANELHKKGKYKRNSPFHDDIMDYKMNKHTYEMNSIFLQEIGRNMAIEIDTQAMEAMKISV